VTVQNGAVHNNSATGALLYSGSNLAGNDST